MFCMVGHLVFWHGGILFFLLVLEQDGEGIAEALKRYEVKVQQLEKDLFFYKKTSRELKKKLKCRFGESSHRLSASTNCKYILRIS